jgi:uncharacterized Zn finger protein
MTCPKCQSTEIVHQLPATAPAVPLDLLRCTACGHTWSVERKPTSVPQADGDSRQP